MFWAEEYFVGAIAWLGFQNIMWKWWGWGIGLRIGYSEVCL